MRNFLRLARRDGRNQAAVQTAAEQHAVRHLGHQPFPDGLLEGLAEELEVRRLRRDNRLRAVEVAVPPARLEIARRGVISAVVDVAGREGDDLVAEVRECLELGREEGRAGARGAPALVESRDADGVARGDDAGRGHGLVEEDEGEHAVEEGA